jgi:hypothetical protein
MLYLQQIYVYALEFYNKWLEYISGCDFYEWNQHVFLFSLFMKKNQMKISTIRSSYIYTIHFQFLLS